MSAAARETPSRGNAEQGNPAQNSQLHLGIYQLCRACELALFKREPVPHLTLVAVGLYWSNSSAFSNAIFFFSYPYFEQESSHATRFPHNQLFWSMSPLHIDEGFLGCDYVRMFRFLETQELRERTWVTQSPGAHCTTLGRLY